MRSILALAAGLTLITAGSMASAGDTLPSCEDAAASYIDDANAKVDQTDLNRSDYAAVLDHGAYLDPCNVPRDMTVKICAAVQKGKAVGLTISTSPSDSSIEACVKEQVAALEFPSHPRMDVAKTTFAPEPKDDAPPSVDTSSTGEPPPAVAPKKSGCGCSVPRPDGTPVAALALLAAVVGPRAFGRR